MISESEAIGYKIINPGSEGDFLILCYFNRKRYQIIFRDDDTNKRIPPDWPEPVKTFISNKLIPVSVLRLSKVTRASTAEDMTMDKRFTQLVKHPKSGTLDKLANVVMNLNDGCGWTREQIADWLETLDDQPRFTLAAELEAQTEDETSGRVFEFAFVDEMQPA